MSAGNFVYLTRERLIELERELQEMKTNGRKQIAAKIAEARAHGDLSENAEYDAAKEEQGLFCLLYTSDAADERSSVDLGGRRINKKKKKKTH